MMSRIVCFAYGLAAYAIFLAAFLYAIGFVGNLMVPKSIDTGPAGAPGLALAIDLLLLSLFAIQHSVMARQWFKSRWTKLVAPAIERSTYVLISSLLLLLLYWQWRPLPAIVWHVQSAPARAAALALFALGWLIVFLSTFMIDHFDLMGLRQVWLNLRRQDYTPVEFKSSGFYRYVRHPIMLGFIIAFWATPVMTVGHLVFAIATTGYILVGVMQEERDLVRLYGDTYRQYRARIRALLPLP